MDCFVYAKSQQAAVDTTGVAHGDPAHSLIIELLLNAPQRRCCKVPDNFVIPATHGIVEAKQRFDASYAFIERERFVTTTNARVG